MDFHLNETQREVAGLAAQVFDRQAGPERLAAVEATPRRIDDQLWGTLASTGLLGIALPSAEGGADLGLIELATVLQAQGRRVAPVPLWSAVTAALAVARHGTPDQRSRWTAGTVDGTVLLSVALEEFGGSVDPYRPQVTATPEGDDWVLSGVKAAVPAGHIADGVVVSAGTPGGSGLFLVDLATAAVERETAETADAQAVAHLTFAQTPAEAVGPPDGVALSWLVDTVGIAIAALQIGVISEALQMAAAYVSERQQFGVPLGTFQSVAHKIADGHIDLEAMRVTLWHAAWKADEGLDPSDSVQVARWWAADAGLRVMHRVQHLHGGIGVDLDYPLHRYLLWATELAGVLGGASAHLARLEPQLQEIPQ